MGADVADRTRARDFFLEAPGAGAVGVGRPVLEVGAAKIQDFADAALLDELAGEGHGGGAAVIEGHHGDDAGPLDGVQHGLGLVARAGERLFAEDVLSGFGGGDGDGGVAVVGRADVDDVDVGAADDLPPVGCGLLEAEAAAAVLGVGGGEVADDLAHGDGRGRPEEHGHDGAGHGVGLAHEPAADHRDVQVFCHSRCLPSAIRVALPVIADPAGGGQGRRGAQAGCGSRRCQSVPRCQT